jgi:CheY-like chemotaxis protein
MVSDSIGRGTRRSKNRPGGSCVFPRRWWTSASGSTSRRRAGHHLGTASLPPIRPAGPLQVAETGREGLRKSAEEAYDLIILDRGLPDLDGLEVLRRLRQQARLKQVPVVMLSASALPMDVTACMEAGAAACWTQPIDIERWGADLAACLSLRQAPPEREPVSADVRPAPSAIAG